MENQRIITQIGFHESGFDGFQTFEIQVLFTRELIGTVGVADRDGQRVRAGRFHEFNGFGRTGIDTGFIEFTGTFTIIMLRTNEFAQFAFNYGIMGMGVFHHFLGDSDVFFKGQMAAVDHNAGKTFIDTFFAEFKGIAMIQMDSDRNIGKADSGLDELLQIDRVGIAAGTAGDLKDEGSFFFFARGNDGLHELHVIHVECPKSVFTF